MTTTSRREPGSGVRVDIALLVYNEAATIGPFLEHLTAQSIFKQSDLETRLVIVANGCTDGTAPVCRSTLSPGGVADRVDRWEVHDIEQKGKPNAWNLYVHELATDDVDLVIFLDADIVLLSDRACELAVDALLSDPLALVAVDRPRKDTALKANPTILDRVNNAVANSEAALGESITGQFYCVRMSALRQVRMPTGIIGEDGFLRAMILTDNFDQAEDLAKITLASGAEHSFEALKGPREFFHHQVRLTIGTITNIVLFGLLRERDAAGVAPVDYIDDRNRSDPQWLTGQVADGWLDASNRAARRRFRRRRLATLGNLALQRRIVLALPYLVATALDLVTYRVAIRRIEDGTAVGFW